MALLQSASRSSVSPLSPEVGLVLATTAIVVGLIYSNPLAVLTGALVVDADYANAAAAFVVFTTDAWSWPPGANPAFGDINIFFSDGAPGLALIAKAIYGVTGLSIPFHALLWLNPLLFCLFAWRLSQMLFASSGACLLLFWLLCFNLMLPVRIIGAQHIALSSFWLVLWAMTAVPVSRERRGIAQHHECIAVVIVATLTHAYLAAMAITIVGVFLIAARRFGALLVAVTVPVAILWTLGALDAPRVPVGGAKRLALDLAAFVHSHDWGVLPPVYGLTDYAQGEAMVFIGTGACLALAVGVSAMALSRRTRRALATTFKPEGTRRFVLAALAGGALTLFAMAFNLRIAGPVILDIPIPAVLMPLYENFRATGRFAGVLSYALIVGAGAMLAALIATHPRFAIIALAAIGLQVGDLYRSGHRSPTPDQFTDAALQREAIDALLAPGWSGRVYREADIATLENQRFIDFALVENEARWFNRAHAARLPLAHAESRPDISDARSGDLVITGWMNAEAQSCRRSTIVKVYRLCIVDETTAGM